SLADDLRACIGGLVVSPCVVLDAAHEAASLGTLERGLELRGQRLGLLRVAEKASALAGSRAKPKEYVGFREFGIGHLVRDPIDHADASVKRVVALAAVLAHAFEHELDASLRGEIVRRRDSG